MEWAHVCGGGGARFALRAGLVAAGQSVQEYDQVLQQSEVGELMVLRECRRRTR